MPTLTGTLAYVTGQPVPPTAIRHVTVRATHTRTNGTELVTTRTVPVDHTGTLTLTLEPGTATLHVDLDTGHDTGRHLIPALPFRPTRGAFSDLEARCPL